MLLRRFAAVSAVLVTSAGLAPAVTHADTPASTLYVSNATGSNCSDAAGLGTQAEPFCTLQAAVDVVNPGQTISVGHGTYAPVTITRSGTASAPINIVGAPRQPGSGYPAAWIGQLGGPSWTGPALAVNGASYVNITEFGLRSGSAGALTVSHAANITLNQMRLNGSVFDTSAPIVDITGASSAVTFERAYIYPVVNSTPVTDVEVEGGSTGTVISTDFAYAWASVPIVSVNDAPGTDIVSNTFSPTGCHTTLELAGTSQNSVIENNDFQVGTPSSCPTPPPVISADSTAAPTATDDYNTLLSNGTDYGWGGNSYANPAKFFAATGQGAHDLDYSSDAASLIDSANSAAPGELPTDLWGNSRVDDPLVADTGAGPATYYDRGATETQEPMQLGYKVSATQAPTGGTVTFTANLINGWNKTPTYVFDFGDGTTPVTNTTGVASHVYTTTGSFTTSVTTTGVTGAKDSNTAQITIVPPAPLVAAMSVSSAGSMTAVVAQQSTDSWNMTGYTLDFGDGTGQGQLQAGEQQTVHHYRRVGTYTITLMTKDAGGNQASTSQKFTTAGSMYTPYGPVRVLDTRHGTGTGGVVAKLGANQTLKLKIAGNGAIPANVSAVAFNLTVANPDAGGYLTAFPDGQPKPATSNLNFTPGQTKATSVIVAVGPDGDVSLFNGSGGPVDLVADVNGYFTQTEAEGYLPRTPGRVLDTRHGIGTDGATAKLGAGQTLTLSLFPFTRYFSGVHAVVLNLTAVNEAAGGYVTAYPDGSPRPPTSSLNFAAGQIVPNTVIVPVGGNQKIDLYNGSGGPIDLVADLQGFFATGNDDAYVPMTPQRLYDSRQGAGGPLSSGGTTSVRLQPLGADTAIDFSQSAIAYTFNVTVTQTVGSGYVTVYPADQLLQPTSNLNFGAGQTTANTAIAASATNTADDIFAVTFVQPASSTQLIVDLFGYFSAE